MILFSTRFWDHLTGRSAERLSAEIAEQGYLLREWVQAAGDLAQRLEVDRLDQDRLERLSSWQGAMEVAGIRRKWGGVIDVDYDKFLAALGPESCAELRRVLASPKRSKAGRRKKHENDG